MIVFFKKVRRILLDSGNGKKYFFYVIGEIVLVVIGILIALQINNWNQEKLDKRIEYKLLIELKENLVTNEERLKQSIEEEYISARSIGYVVQALENRVPHNDTMNYHFGRSDFSADVVITSTAFEAIKSKGFDIISSNEMRKDIIDLFDSEYGVMLSQTIRLEDQFWPTASLPMFHKHFRIKEMKKRDLSNTTYNAVPVNYNALLDDTTYINMIKHRGSFRYSGAALKEFALKKTKTLNQKLELYLGKN